jgi:hypothetical protein
MNLKGIIGSLLVEKVTALDTKPVAELACVNDFYSIINFLFLIFMPGFMELYSKVCRLALKYHLFGPKLNVFFFIFVILYLSLAVWPL